MTLGAKDHATCKAIIQKHLDAAPDVLNEQAKGYPAYSLRIQNHFQQSIRESFEKSIIKPLMVAKLELHMMIRDQAAANPELHSAFTVTVDRIYADLKPVIEASSRFKLSI